MLLIGALAWDQRTDTRHAFGVIDGFTLFVVRMGTVRARPPLHQAPRRK